MTRHHDQYGRGNDGTHGLGDSARRNAEADYDARFGSGHRTRNPEPFDTDYRSEPRDDFDERYAGGESRLSGRGWSGDGGLAHAARGRSQDAAAGPHQSSEHPGREHSTGYRGCGPKNFARSDERIQEDICERLWNADDVDARDVSVEVKDGVVTLSGNVAQRRTRHRIEDLADDCSGVKDIQNDIRVQTPNEWPYAKGEAAGAAGATSGRSDGANASAEAGAKNRDEGMIQSAISNMPP